MKIEYRFIIMYCTSWSWKNYSEHLVRMKDMFVTILGGFMVAAGMERSGAHRRIALNILLLIGTKPAM